MSEPSQDIVPDLGTLHRVCILENILLKAGLGSRGIDAATSSESSPLEGSPFRETVPSTENDPVVTTNGVSPEPTEPSPALKAASEMPDGPREHNAKALKHLTHSLPSALAPFFQGQ